MIPQIPQGPGTPFLCPELSGSGGGLEGSEVGWDLPLNHMPTPTYLGKFGTWVV